MKKIEKQIKQQEQFTREHTLSQAQLKKLIKEKFERASAMYYSPARRESILSDR
jgi:hypothetical protein